MSMNINGCTTCNTPGTEHYESFTYGLKKKKSVQYDYRHTDGELFTCCAPTLEDCRTRRDQWLKNKTA